MKDAKLIAKKRTLEGSSNARRMRSAGSLPGVVYGSEKEPVSIEVSAHDFEQILHHHASESLLIEIELESEGDMSVLVKDVQHHPVTGDLLHVDLLRVAANKPIAVDIQIELIGESAGVKMGGILDQVMHSIEIECLPGDLVDMFEFDVSDMNIGDALHVSDLKLDAKYKIMVDDEAIVASVAAPNVAEEDEEESEDTVGEEPEVLTAKQDED